MRLVSHRRHLLFSCCCDNCEIHAIQAAKQPTRIRRRCVAFRFHFWVWFCLPFSPLFAYLFIAIDAYTWGLFFTDSDAITMTPSERTSCRYYLSASTQKIETGLNYLSCLHVMFSLGNVFVFVKVEKFTDLLLLCLANSRTHSLFGSIMPEI